MFIALVANRWEYIFQVWKQNGIWFRDDNAIYIGRINQSLVLKCINHFLMRVWVLYRICDYQGNNGVYDRDKR